MNSINFNKDIKKKVIIEEGEELLHKHYPLSTVDKTKRLLVGVDAGSTQTRVLLIDDLNNEPDTTLYTIPSVSSFVPNDVEIRPQGDLLYNVMDSVIVNLKALNETIFTKRRVVRGTKKTDFGGAENRISSSNQKIKSEVFYINIIDAIGYALCQKYKDSIPKNVELVVGVALPPDDRQSTTNRNAFKRQLLGQYSWTHTDSDVSINIDIAETTILTEPEAFIKAYYSTTDEEIPEYILHINGGGRSIGVELLANGIPIEKTSKSLYYGGTQLLDNLGELIAKTEGGRAAKEQALRKAINTGFLTSGKTVKDVVDYIKTVKAEMADKIYTDVTKYVFDAQQEVAIEDIAEISVSGRLFESGEYDISIADFLGEKYKQVSPNTEFIRMEGNLIPLGLAFSVCKDYYGFLEDSSIDLSAEPEDNIDEDETYV